MTVDPTDVVLDHVSSGVAHLTLNRPEKLNAIDGAVHDALVTGLQRAAENPDVTCVVLRGAGSSFSAGGDVKAVAAGEDVGDPEELCQAIWRMPKPVIAAVHGYCLGQAFEIAAMCDFTVATATAKFGEVEIQHGWGPPLLITPYVTGIKAAKEILLLGEVFDATTALRLGLVSRVVPDEDLDVATRKITDRLSVLDQDIVRANKAAINGVMELAGLWGRR